MISSLDTIREIGSQIDGALTDGIAKLAPWLAPIPTAYLVGRATVDHLHWPVWVGVVAAIIVESLGLATTSTALTLRDYNRAKRKSDPHAPFTLAAVLVGVYLTVAILLTVALDIVPVLAVYSPAIFPLLSLIGVTVLALRSDHKRRLQAIAEDKRKRSQKRSERRSAKRASEQPSVHDSVSLGNLDKANRSRTASKQEAMNALLNVYMNDPSLSYSRAGQAVGRSKSWVASALSELQEAGKVKKNGQGIEVLQ